MKNEEEQLKTPLECYKNGELVLLTMQEAIDELLRANYGFVGPLATCTWNVGGCRGYNKRVFKVAGAKPMALGIYLYSCHGQPVTVDEAEAIINRKKELAQDLFIAWIARFNKIFRKGYEGQPLPKKLWPFQFVKVASGKLLRPAYQMRDDHSCFVVMGVDRDNVDPAVVPNWSLLWRKLMENWEK